MAGRIGWGLLVLGICGAAAGMLAGYGIARGVSRSIEQLGGPVSEMADVLSEVGGETPLVLRAELPELETTMRDLADRTTTVVKQLQETRRHAERSEQLAAVGQLAAGLAHELRNPLTSIKLIVQTAADRRASPGGRDLEVVQEEIARLEHLLQAFLDFARPPRLMKQPVEVCQLVEQTVELARPRAHRQGVTLHCQPPFRETWTEVDSQQFRQVLLNLLLNALDAMPQGGTVSVSLSSSGQRQLVLQVADDGCGLPRALGERIFQPFVSTKETGIGLGLSICRRIVEAHGGTIQAANARGGGAVFRIQLPAAPAQPSAAQPSAAQPSAAQPSADSRPSAASTAPASVLSRDGSRSLPPAAHPQSYPAYSVSEQNDP